MSILENRPEGSEIIVVLGCEYDDPWNIREEVEFVRAPKRSSLVGCVNVGISACSGGIIHVLAPGWRATPDWAAGPMERFRDDAVGAVAPSVVSDTDRSRVVVRGIAYRDAGRRVVVKPSRRDGDRIAPTETRGPLLEAGFWRVELFGLDGPGFASACGDRCADADLAVTAKAAGYQTIFDGTSRVVEPAIKPAAEGGFASALHAERLYWRSAAVRTGWSASMRHVFEIIRHAVARGPIAMLPALAGRFVGMLDFGSSIARFRRLRAVATVRDERVEAGSILRFDGRHESVHRPKAQPAEALRRSA